jgi:plastocyanin
MEYTVSSAVEVPVALANDHLTVAPCAVQPGDRVRWLAGEHTVSIWFPKAGVFPAPALAVHKSGDIEITVPRNARPGRYQYIVYCHDSDRFGMTDELPVMEVKEPW